MSTECPKCKALGRSPKDTCKHALINQRDEAVALLRRAFDVLCNMTTEEFRVGSDKPVRDAIEPFLSRIDKAGA